jgi:hypothetical protein
MENGRMVINGFGFGVLVLALSINLSANNIVCVNGKCRALISKKSNHDKNNSDNHYNVDKSNLFVSLDDNEVIEEDNAVVSSLKKVDNKKDNLLNIDRDRMDKIYACDDNHELVCSIEKNRDKKEETCECVS